MVIPVLLNHKISGYNKNDIIIREANTNDAQEVSRIVYERNGNPLDEIIDIVLTDIETIRSNKKKAIALVICINQKIIAFSKCIHSEYFKRSNYTNLPKGWYLCDLKVMEKYRTNGIGKLLTLYRLNWISRRANKAFYYSKERQIKKYHINQQRR